MEFVLSDPYRTQHHHRVYLVGDRVFKNKIEALLYHKQHPNESVVYDWNNDFWSNFAWREPEQSMDQLCMDFARHLREKFKKVYLTFSGGWDTWTIVDYFRRADVIIDGFIINDWHWRPRTDIGYVKKRAKWVKDNVWPDLDIRLFENTAEVGLSLIRAHGDDFVWNHGYTEWISHGLRTREFTLTDIDGRPAQALVDDPETIILDGIDKPRLDLVDGKWYTRFIDYRQFNYPGSPTFPFYINTIEPRIHAKQCYMLARYFQSIGITTHQEYHHWMMDSSSDDRKYIAFNLAVGRTDPKDWVVTGAFLKRQQDNKDHINEYSKNQIYRQLGAIEGEKMIRLYTQGIKKARDLLEYRSDHYQMGSHLTPECELVDANVTTLVLS